MKYIRTKDGILLNSRPNIEDVDGYVLTDKRGLIKKCNVVYQADTIEELCDEFVVKYEDTYHLVDYDCAKSIDVEISNVYGAIWTDKGLIYVAKMNDKGELELI